MENLIFQSEWSYQLLNHMKSGCDKKTCKAILQKCADYHYAQMSMDEVLKDYRGNLEGFIEYVTNTWGWIVTYDKEKKQIIADENKEFCVCPMVQDHPKKTVSNVLCHCSEGFAQKMFSVVTGNKVEAEVIRSVLSGDKTCVYRIRILD